MAKTLVYQMYPIAWPGGLRAMTKHLLEYVKELEVDYVWLSPVYPSPRFDHGYDIKDYAAIDPRIGTMQDFDNFVARAHKLGIGVLMDLVLNHTSTAHPWFREKPGYYCWRNDNLPGWKNLFDGGSAWREDPDEERRKESNYYLHLFHETQADLNWFPYGDERVNPFLVREFKAIVNFWLRDHDVDGFRLDCPQAINKDFSKKTLEFDNLLRGGKDAAVINAIFADTDAPRTKSGQKPFLIMECFDPSFGDFVDYYAEHTPVDFVMNMLVKQSIDGGHLAEFKQILNRSAARKNFMLDLESHDAPRFTSRSGLNVESICAYMFETNQQAICLYQGQELGLTNPSWFELSDAEMLSLDAQTAMRAKKGELLLNLRPLSRANARIPISSSVYNRQKRDPRSNFHLMQFYIACWKYW